jgi:murein DD-endopeptidase MepM/ murein hydrolase activator NlpD
MKIKLSLPLKDIMITQPFGVNYVGFYEKMGLKGHNGLDFKAKTGARLYACHDGVVTYSGTDSTGGKCIEICSSVEGVGYKTIYYHLSILKSRKGDLVKTGDEIGRTGNTGKYTTGPHLHLGLKKIYDGDTINYHNGYRGAINPSDYFKKDWEMSNAYHRYGRKQNWMAEFLMRFKNKWLHKQLKKINGLEKVNDTEFINALVYGGWDYNSVINPALYEVWAFMKKDEFTRGKIAFK